MLAAPVSSLLLPVAMLVLMWPSQKLSEACSCSPVHPQQAFCNADIVIRAKAITGKEVDSGNDVYGNPIKRIQYEIKQIKFVYLFDNAILSPALTLHFPFTAPSGKADGDGKMHVTLCDFIVPWDSLSPTQKKSLNQRYEMGCECKISRCPSIPCLVSSQDECLWTDWVTEKNINGRQAKHYACIKRTDGSCSWYRGVAPPKQEFLDIEDP
uniref:Metalloproteinase inhibitor 2 n=1 Tax=Xenopus tropicalis TaxID=8364 RepID=A0A6I8QZT7_XENTR